jgi:hypothetical protein
LPKKAFSDKEVLFRQSRTFQKSFGFTFWLPCQVISASFSGLDLLSLIRLPAVYPAAVASR